MNPVTLMNIASTKICTLHTTYIACLLPHENVQVHFNGDMAPTGILIVIAIASVGCGL